VSARALLLDRDGVVNVDRGHVHRIADVAFVPGIFDLCRAAHALGFLIVIVTNQGGIGRGLYTESDFRALTAWMERRFKDEGAPIARVYHSPYHPEHGVGPYRREAECRKPGPGMLRKARADLGLDLGASILVGDRASDIEAGWRAGVGANVLFRTVTGASAEARGGADVPECDGVFTSLDALRAWLIERECVGRPGG
jgi:D-glycero-D-manno-heptose 1,7-bisphosphate phosphatase